MKKIMTSFLLIGLFFLISCGKNLSSREASSKDVVENFLKSMIEGNIEKAKVFIMSQLIENEDIKTFLANKVESYEYIEEIEPITSNEQIKKELSKNKDKANKIKENLDTNINGLSKVINESMHSVKITINGETKYYAIFVFSSQNLKSITSIIDITDFAKSVGETNIKSKIEACIL